MKYRRAENVGGEFNLAGCEPTAEIKSAKYYGHGRYDVIIALRDRYVGGVCVSSMCIMAMYCYLKRKNKPCVGLPSVVPSLSRKDIQRVDKGVEHLVEQEVPLRKSVGSTSNIRQKNKCRSVNMQQRMGPHVQVDISPKVWTERYPKQQQEGVNSILDSNEIHDSTEW